MIQRHIFNVDGDGLAPDNAIVLSPDSLAADVSLMSLGGSADNPIVISPDQSIVDESMMSIGSSTANP
ncbi:hypothetical protein F4801DRAFT_573348 [Xylaria longipes]|nr:hypothetical protein F4801DRAFT_573348 [Xylaria longipes]